MFKKINFIILSGFLLLNMCGCAALLAGAVSGAGTAVWLSGKLSQEFHYPYERTIDATKAALQSLKLEITKETREGNVLQLRSKYSDGKEIWIDIRKVTKDSTKVEVRVGVVSPDKAASDKILKEIQRHL
jgi:hypothetical protein